MFLQASHYSLACDYITFRRENPELTEPVDDQLCDTGYPGSNNVRLSEARGLRHKTWVAVQAGIFRLSWLNVLLHTTMICGLITLLTSLSAL